VHNLYAPSTSAVPDDPAAGPALDLLLAQLDGHPAQAAVPSLPDFNEAAPSTQKALSALVHAVTLSSLMDTDVLNKARLHAVCLPHAHAWLTALPLTDRLRIPATEFRQAARYRLGVCDPPTDAPCRECRGARLGFMRTTR
jgi:hypothetical protein